MHINNLSQYYFINKFDPEHIKKLDKNISIIYRNYSIKTNYELILKIKEFCKKNNRKFFLSNDVKLAYKLGLNGVYLPSFNNETIHKCYRLNKNFQIIGSAHNIKEINLKRRQGVTTIFVSSLFKKNKNYLGVNRFKNIIKDKKLNIIALGGINLKNIKKLLLLNIVGFAGISFFDQKKGPYKNRGL